MPSGLLRHQVDNNNWMKLNNYFKSINEYISISLNGDNPPTIDQYTRFNFWGSTFGSVPSSEASGDNEYVAGGTFDYIINSAIYEDNSAQTFTWGSGSFPSSGSLVTGTTYYLFCNGPQDTSTNTIGLGSYGVSTVIGSYDYSKGGQYNSTGSRVLAEFVLSTNSTIGELKTDDYNKRITANLYGDIDIGGTVNSTVTFNERVGFDARVDFSSEVIFDENVTLNSTVKFFDDVRFDSTVTFSSRVTIVEALYCQGTVGIEGQFGASSQSFFSGGVEFNSTVSFNDPTYFSTNVDIVGELDVTSSATFSSETRFGRLATFTSQIEVDGIATFSTNVGINTTSLNSNFNIVESGSACVTHIDTYFETDGGRSQIHLRKSSTNTKLSQSAVVNGEALGGVQGWGSDGTTFYKGASIEFLVDGTPGSSSVPGKICFYTTPEGDSDSTERMCINSNGVVDINNGMSLRTVTSTAMTQTALWALLGDPSSYAIGYTIYVQVGTPSGGSYHHVVANGSTRWKANSFTTPPT